MEFYGVLYDVYCDEDPRFVNFGKRFQVISRSEKLGSTSAIVFAVTFSRDVYIRELKAYAGSLERVYVGKKVIQLIPDIRDSIKVVCQIQEGPARLITRPPFDAQAVHRRGKVFL